MLPAPFGSHRLTLRREADLIFYPEQPRRGNHEMKSRREFQAADRVTLIKQMTRG